MKLKIGWIGLGLTAVALRAVLTNHPGWVEQYYSRGLFLGIRWTIDYLLAWLPVPLIYLFVAGLLFWLVRTWRRRQVRTWNQRLLPSSLSLAPFAGGAAFFFLLSTTDAWRLNVNWNWMSNRCRRRSWDGNWSGKPDASLNCAPAFLAPPPTR